MVARNVLGSNSRCFLTPITRLDVPVRKVDAETRSTNEAKMNELRKDVTDYDTIDRQKRKFYLLLVSKSWQKIPLASF
jgi:hypothetical protein